MIKINVTKRKIVEFDVNVKGVDPNALSGRLSLFYENVIYSFPAIVEDGNVVRVEIPALDEVIKGDIPDKYQATLKLEMVGADTFMQPWGGTAFLEHPIKVEAVMRSGGQRLEEEEEAPKVKATLKLLKEEPKYDIKTLASGTSNKKSGEEEKEKEELKKQKEKEKKEKSKLAKKLGGEKEEEQQATQESRISKALNERGFQRGDSVGVDMNAVKKYDSSPPYLKLISSMLKRGKGKLEIIRFSGPDNQKAQLAVNAIDALVGTVEVPLSALK